MHFWRYRGTFDRRLQFEGILDFDAENGIREVQVPDDWSRVASDEEGTVEYIVYEVQGSGR